MKTILLIFFLSCCGVLAQAPATNPNPTNAPANQNLRHAFGADTNMALPSFPTQIPRRGRPRPNATNGVPGVTPAAAIAPGGNVVVPPGAATNNPAAGSVPAGLANPADAANGTDAATGKNGETVIPAGEINFPAVSLEQVLPIYAELVDRTILHAQLPPILISLKTQTPLTKTEAIQAFNSVLAMNGIVMMNVGEKFVKAVPVNLANAQGAPFNRGDASQLPEADVYVTQIVQLTNAKPTEVVPILQPLAQIPNSILAIDGSSLLIIRDFSSNVKRMLELVKQIDVTVPLDFDQEVIPIKYAQAQDIASALSSLGGGTGTSIGQGRGGGGGARTGASGFGGAGGIGGGLGGGIGGGYGGAAGLGTTPGITQPGGIGGAAGGARTTSFGDRLNSIVSRAASQGDFHVLGQTKIIADQRTNSLLVFASKQDMEMIKNIVAKLDIVLAQVLIEAIIMEVTLDNSRSLGVSYLQNNPSTPGNYFSGIGGINNGTFLNPGSFVNTGTNAAANIPSGLSYFANFGGDFQATLTAIAANDRVNVLSRPRIQTSHGVPASLQVGDTVPEVSGTYFGGINGQASSQYQQTFVGINLQVTPLINPDGLVVMDILQDVQQLGPSTIIDGNPVPTTSKRTAQATVSVRDKDTIILGGMISTSKSTSRSGVPLLKDIPGLGYLFRSTVDSGKRVELIVLIRPTVLPTPEAAALVATHEREKLPGIKAAERDERIEENQRLKEADKIKVPKERD